MSHSGVGGAVLRLSDTDDGRRAGLAGLQSCGSVWACPVCARKIAARRAVEVRSVLEAVAADNGSAALVTLTFRHRRGQRLGHLWDALSAAWGAVTSGRGWVADQQVFGIRGWLRTVETTHGDAGWHVHVHAVMVFDGPVSQELSEELGHRMFTRWARALGRKGLSAVEESGGLDVRSIRMHADSLERVGEYIAKVGFEITSPSTKDGRYGNRAPFAILRDALATGLADDCDLWLEWEAGSHNRRQLTWSQGLREWARLGREATDQEIVDQDQHGDDVLILPPETWLAVRERVAELLDAAEVDGAVGAIRWLDTRGLAWRIGSSVGQTAGPS